MFCRKLFLNRGSQFTWEPIHLGANLLLLKNIFCSGNPRILFEFYFTFVLSLILLTFLISQMKIILLHILTPITTYFVMFIKLLNVFNMTHLFTEYIFMESDSHNSINKFHKSHRNICIRKNKINENVSRFVFKGISFPFILFSFLLRPYLVLFHKHKKN